ncbi:MAG: helix-turn-helix domain-containing protein [Kineosporiaceae bacterium]|nr:helix-turn-helix domain-containing protein [Kineosporiaceae bacterium]MBK8075135.1 helix-turn-helix domain-containing protein [Kineosporiaceae bacterium]
MNNAEELGQMIAARRRALGWTLETLAEAAGLNRSSVMRLEQGRFASPSPEALSGLAGALGLAAADLFAVAGYSTPQDVPTLRPYLRAKYGVLPESAIAEVEAYLTAVAAQYGGVAAGGPLNGEDEQPEEPVRR